LIEHGRQRILCLGGDPDLYTIQERQRGYKDAVAQASLVPELLYAADTSTLIDKLRACLNRSATKRPDSVLGLLNAGSIAAYEELMNLGRKIPQDVALIGFDDFPLSSTLRPAISVIRQPVAEIGRAATHLIFEQIEMKTTTPHHLRLGTEFIQRKSCGC
jgi:LacI family transcriptional regulator